MIDKLEFLMALARERHFGRAAETCRRAAFDRSSDRTLHNIGLVVPAREPMTPLNAALVAEARRIAATVRE